MSKANPKPNITNTWIARHIQSNSRACLSLSCNHHKQTTSKQHDAQHGITNINTKSLNMVSNKVHATFKQPHQIDQVEFLVRVRFKP
jgi:hypothetical protein